MRYFEKAFHVVIIASFVGLISGIAHADSFVTTGKLIRKEPIITYVTVNKPVYRCWEEKEPVYGTVQGNGASAGDVLGGMILGGILGKGVTGKDNGAAVGAVIGGMVAADNKQSKQVITGYRTVSKCGNHTSSRTEERVNQYRLVYLVDGHEFAYTVNSAQGNNAWVGQSKRFRIRYQMLD
jgi:uncharacterized protein YcfJ